MMFSIRSTLPPFSTGVTTVSVRNGDQCQFCRPSVRTAVLSDTFKSKKKCQTLHTGTTLRDLYPCTGCAHVRWCPTRSRGQAGTPPICLAALSHGRMVSSQTPNVVMVLSHYKAVARCLTRLLCTHTGRC